MGQQPLPVRRARTVGPLAEEDVLTDRHRVRAQQLGELPGVPVGVQAHPAEVVAELLLQLPPYAQVERLSGPADDVLRLRRTGLRARSLRLRAPFGLGRLRVLGM